jgi:hypothetical protein
LTKCEARLAQAQPVIGSDKHSVECDRSTMKETTTSIVL